MKIEIVVDGTTIHTQHADKYYVDEFYEFINNMSRILGVRLGEKNLSVDEIYIGVNMLALGHSVEWIRKELWGR